MNSTNMNSQNIVPVVGNEAAIIDHFDRHAVIVTITRVTRTGQIVVKSQHGRERRFDTSLREMGYHGSYYTRARLVLDADRARRAETRRIASIRAANAINAVTVDARATDKWSKATLNEYLVKLEEKLVAARLAVDAIEDNTN